MRGVTWSSTVAGISVLSALPPHSSFAPLAMASSISALQCSTVPMPITEPSTTGSGLRGSPNGRPLAFFANSAAKSSAILRSTTRRSVLMQIWPLLAKAPKAAAFTASSRFASSSTSSGALPPSSSTAGFRYLAQVIAISLPTRVLPVKFTRRTAGCATIASTTLAASAGALVM